MIPQVLTEINHITIVMIREAASISNNTFIKFKKLSPIPCEKNIIRFIMINVTMARNLKYCNPVSENSILSINRVLLVSIVNAFFLNPLVWPSLTRIRCLKYVLNLLTVHAYDLMNGLYDTLR